ncbi:MAG: hypothetical protein Q8R92_10055 [Deltaproteobacteria bacterium]|nr:hypothetical protein [Deltaproteobacteria bacterium]
MTRRSGYFAAAASLSTRARAPRKIDLGSGRTLEITASPVFAQGWSGAMKFSISLVLHRGLNKSPVRLEIPGRALRALIRELEQIEDVIRGRA